jgi:ribosomal protein S18 acetylase RimI-like enzyme
MTNVMRLPESEISRAGDLLAHSFFNDSIVKYMLPNEAERLKLMPWHFAAFGRYAHPFGEVYTTSGIEGVAVWLPPDNTEMTPSRLRQSGLDKAPDVLGKGAWQRFNTVMDYIGKFHHRDVQPRHWYLPLIGIDPAHQGQGLGSMLLAPMLKRADAEDLPCYLETVEPKNVPFYERHGFVIQTEVVEPHSGIRFWTFRRDPQQEPVHSI